MIQYIMLLGDMLFDNIHSIQCIAHFDPLHRPSQYENEATAPFYVHTDKVVLYCSGFFII